MAHIHELYDFTVSAFIMHPFEAKILLLKHKKIGKWLQPGGHIELNEDPLQALTHELIEETGLLPSDYEIIEPADHPMPTGNSTALPTPFYVFVHNYNAQHKHIDLSYTLKANTDVLTQNPDGAEAIGWFSIAEITQKHAEGSLFIDTLQICQWLAQKYFMDTV